MAWCAHLGAWMRLLAVGGWCFALLHGCGSEETPFAGADIVQSDTTGDHGQVSDVKDAASSPEVAACPGLDPEKMRGDLYEHRVQWASSTDGINFTSLPDVLLEHASVPDAVVRSDGAVWVYFVNGQPGQHAVFIAEQQADGTLEVFDCIRLDGEINGNAVDPDIVRLEDGRYRLFYFQGWFVGGTPQSAHPFYSAISEDGVHFAVEQKILFFGYLLVFQFLN